MSVCSREIQFHFIFMIEICLKLDFSEKRRENHIWQWKNPLLVHHVDCSTQNGNCKWNRQEKTVEVCREGKDCVQNSSVFLATRAALAVSKAAYPSHHAVIVIVQDKSSLNWPPPLANLTHLNLKGYTKVASAPIVLSAPPCGKCLNCSFLLMRVALMLISTLVFWVRLSLFLMWRQKKSDRNQKLALCVLTI